MKLSENQLRKYMSAGTNFTYSEKELQKTIKHAKTAFYENEAGEVLSYKEFLYWQSRYIKKRWWILQGLLLLALWCMLKLIGSGFYTQRSMGIAAPLFVVLLVPELWKNKNAGALEIESSAYYSLHQIYAARIFLFALVDMFLLCVFSIAAILTGKILPSEMMIHFFLPYIVTCCICFRTLYSRKAGSEAFACILCMIWSGIWLQIVLNEKVYGAISFPAWCAMTVAAVLYLGYCICRGQKECKEIWEVKSLWNLK